MSFARGRQTIRNDVIAMIASSPTKITPSALEKKIFATYGLNKKNTKRIIKELVSSGNLSYTYEFGATFIEQSFSKPVRISKHVVLVPPDHSYRSEPGDVVARIRPGASFGDGRHPSTRLAINGIEFALLRCQAVDRRRNSVVLDIGTGSGVLVITAVLCGMKNGLGIDIDPCAQMEAAENVKVNSLEDRIVISGQSVENLDRCFPLVTANLRYPSLKKLFNRLTEIADKEGIIILAGFKDDEMVDLLEVYTQNKFKCLWTANELGWAGAVLHKLA
ncbi:MAG: hypothetical protein HKO68_07490 [Desulfobacterales bacterium]|nr:hypothetical protein [Desulfobacterales bacterium]